MGPNEVGELTMAQFNMYLSHIQYVSPHSKDFGKQPPAPALPKLPILRYAERCSVIVPYEVHKDLITGG